MKDKKDPSTLFNTLTVGNVRKLIKKKVIDSGMIPKASACVNAIKGGVKKAHILDAGIPHALLLEIFTDRGIGTEIVK
jgi:acetylglutamate kinase